MERLLAPNGKEPNANWTAGGDMELISIPDGAVAAKFLILISLLLCRSVRRMLIGCERGMEFDMSLCVDCEFLEN